MMMRILMIFEHKDEKRVPIPRKKNMSTWDGDRCMAPPTVCLHHP